MDTAPFESALQTLTQEYWDANQRPLLLSQLPVLLRDRQIDFRTTLGDKSLKSFVTRVADANHFKVVIDPTHKAKIGLIPDSVAYEFPIEVLPSQTNAVSEISSAQNDAVVLLGILSKLDAADLEKIDIPVSVLAKLFKQP